MAGITKRNMASSTMHPADRRIEQYEWPKLEMDLDAV
jgi:hypothetical protein